MERHENFSARPEARGDEPGRPPGEAARQGLLLRYLGAVAEAAARHRDEVEQAPSAPAAPRPEPVREGPGLGRPTVREVMDVPAAHVPADLPYRDIARVLADEQAGALPVVDAEDRVVGVVSESDLLAKVAFEASGHRPGPIGRLRERRLHGKAHGETAADLMTSPAITVQPGATVAEAAWLAALSRLKRMPVTDHSGRLVGVVRRTPCSRRSSGTTPGSGPRSRPRSRPARPPADRKAVRVTVRDGVVELTGRMPAATAARLLAEVEKITGVVEVKNLTTAD
ncbi:CBS domain-containing protein [Streptomyces misionensis]|uniref:CBS domain-containing protein n=2 Tax=Streptomyces misionensis TaxID=67331 RepID=UPI0036D17190